MLLLAVVNVDLRFAHTGVGYGLRQCLAVGRKLPFICLDRLAFQLVGQLDVVIVDFTGGDGGPLGDARPGGRVILAVELEVEAFFVDRVGA